jgi:hypothetical protein
MFFENQVSILPKIHRALPKTSFFFFDILWTGHHDIFA